MPYSAEIQLLFTVLSKPVIELDSLLPPWTRGIRYVRGIEYEEIEPPSQALLEAAYIISDLEAWRTEGEELQLVIELNCVISMMGLLPEGTGYMWDLDKRNSGIIGPFDNCWAVLRRLSSLALNLCGISPLPVDQNTFMRLLTIANIEIEGANNEI